MAQEYKLADVQHDNNPFTDPHGNTWLTVAFEGVSEPVKWVVKDTNNVRVGDNYYGEIREATSKAGKAYQRFHREQRPDQAQSYSGSPAPSGGKREWTPRDDSAIQAQWAIGQSVQLYSLEAKEHELGPHMNVIEARAKELFAMIDRVKVGAKATDDGERAVAQYESERDIVVTDIGDEPFNLNDIPF